MPEVKKVTDARRVRIKSAVSAFGEPDILKAFDMAQQSDFLSGRAKDWNATFDWILKPGNMTKVLEGNYANKNKPAKTETPNNIYAQLYAEAVASGEDAYEDPFGLDEPLLPEPEIEEAEIE